MKIKSTKEKMRGLGLVNFTKTPHHPIDENGKVRNPVISKKEFRKLQAGKVIEISKSAFENICGKYPGLCEDVSQQVPANQPTDVCADITKTEPHNHNSGEVADVGPDTLK